MKYNKTNHNILHAAFIGINFLIKQSYPRQRNIFIGYVFKYSNANPQKSQLLVKDPIQKENLKKSLTQDLSYVHLFINRWNLVIFCITCNKEIFDIYQQNFAQKRKCSTQKDKYILTNKLINPFQIRQYFLKPLNQQTMFLSNLQYPLSFFKQKKNCSIFISNIRNSFFAVALRFIAFIPTLSLIAEKINPQKIKSNTLKGIIQILQLLSSGKYRVLKINEIQNTFFQQFPQYLSYEKRDPAQVIFQIFKLIQKELSWKDISCKSKQIIKSQRNQWDLNKQQHRFSPLKEILCSRSIFKQNCMNCQNLKSHQAHIFECLKLYANLSQSTFSRKKTIQLNAVKAIEESFQMQYKDLQNLSFCNKCEQNSQSQRQIIIEPGNYLLFQLQSPDNVKTLIPKQFDLKKLDSNKCLVQQDGCIYDLMAAVYKQSDQKSFYSDEYAIAVYHTDNKKCLYFHENIIDQSENLILEKKFTTLIYKRRINQSLIPIVKNIQSTLYLAETGELDIQNPIPLPDFFNVYLSQHHKIPPLMNPFICPHSNINLNIQESTKLKKINYLPVQIYNFLVQEFGGRKINTLKIHHDQNQCKLCVKGLQSLKQIKNIEKQIMKYVDGFAAKRGKVFIYKKWLQKWKSYLYERPSQNYSVWGNPPPFKIDNYLGMENKNPKTMDQSKYSKISIEVWIALATFHGGGPQMSIKKVTASPIVKNYVTLRFQQAKIFYQELNKYLAPTDVNQQLHRRNDFNQVIEEQGDDLVASEEQLSEDQENNQRSASKEKHIISRSKERQKPIKRQKSEQKKNYASSIKERQVVKSKQKSVQRRRNSVSKK